MKASDPEIALQWQVKAMGLPEPELEYRFDSVRRWRFDMAWPDQWLAVEVEGGSWVAGRHTSGAGFEADLEKYTEAALQGWTVIRVSPRMIENGVAINYIVRGLTASTLSSKVTA